MEKIAVLIPCYNEELTVNQVINEFKSKLPDAEIYVYDNNSTDKTLEIASNNPNCIVRTCTIQGKGAVVKQMLSEIDADIYVMTDGDATYNARHVNEMIRLINANSYDMITGDRLSGSYQNQKMTHTFGNHLVDWLIKTKFKNANIKDTMSGLRVFNKKIAKGFAEYAKYNGFEIETELVIYCANQNARMFSMPCDYANRPDGSVSKLNTFKDGWKIIKLILKTKRIKHSKTQKEGNVS